MDDQKAESNRSNQEELLDVHIKHIRSVLEYAAVVWHPGLIAMNCLNIERVQKTCLAIILGERYISYTNALQLTTLEKQKKREGEACASNFQEAQLRTLNSNTGLRKILKL